MVSTTHSCSSVSSRLTALLVLATMTLCAHSQSLGTTTHDGLINNPSGLTLGPHGNLFVADTNSNLIISVNLTTGGVTTIAGQNNVPGYTGNNGPPANALLSGPSDVAFDRSGNLYITDTGNNAVRMISASGLTITTVAGNTSTGYSGDHGLAINSMLNGPQGLAVDKFGNVYISDTGNGVIRFFNVTTGIITTAAGNGGNGNLTDGPALSSTFNQPVGLALDAAGNNLYIADSLNMVIRVLNLATSRVTTLNSGNALSVPNDVKLGSNDRIFVADVGTNTVDSLSSQGATTVLAGGNGSVLQGPGWIAIDSQNNIYIADASNAIYYLQPTATSTASTTSAAATTSTAATTTTPATTTTVARTTSAAITTTPATTTTIPRTTSAVTPTTAPTTARHNNTTLSSPAVRQSGAGTWLVTLVVAIFVGIWI